MEKLVLPAFENYLLRETSVRRVDQFIKILAATKSYSTAKQAKTVLSLAFGPAVRYDALLGRATSAAMPNVLSAARWSRRRRRRRKRGRARRRWSRRRSRAASPAPRRCA